MAHLVASVASLWGAKMISGTRGCGELASD